MPLTVAIAPSGFKEGLSAPDVADAIAAGVARACPDCLIRKLPLVDGGEGFAEALVAATGGSFRNVRVSGPLGEPVDARIGLIPANGGQCAVIEVAEAAGLRLVPRDRRDPTLTTSFGAGELILAALDAEVEQILIGCGDSAVNDGGTGLAEALGCRFLDDAGLMLPRGGGAIARLARIDVSGLDRRLAQVKIEAAVNWHNVLLGARSVSLTYASQKGATPEQARELDEAMRTFASCAREATGRDVGLSPGSGASGGIGAGLAALLGARLCPRYDIVGRYFDLDRFIAGADLVITGEGCIDGNTAPDKIPAEVARRARTAGIPVVALAGILDLDPRACAGIGIDADMSIQDRPRGLQDSMTNAAQLVALAAERAMRLVSVGVAIGGAPPERGNRASANSRG